MQGWTHWLMGAGFFGFGTFKLFTDGSPWLVGLCVVASGYLFYRALTEQTGTPIEDLDLAVSFVRDPKGTLFDHAIDQLVGGDDEEPARTARNERKPGVLQSLVAELDTREEKSSFDADAAIERYLANRPTSQPEPASAPVAAPARAAGFGRKRA